MLSNWRQSVQSRNFIFSMDRHREKLLFETHDLVIGYDEPLSKPLNFSMERGQKIALVGLTESEKQRC